MHRFSCQSLQGVIELGVLLKYHRFCPRLTHKTNCVLCSSPSLRKCHFSVLFYFEWYCDFSTLLIRVLGNIVCKSQSVECAMFLQSIARVQHLASALSHQISVSMTLGVKTRVWKCKPSQCQKMVSLFWAEAANDSDRIKSFLIVELHLLKKHCRYLEPQDLTRFFFFSKAEYYPFALPYFLGHSMYAGPCV